MAQLLADLTTEQLKRAVEIKEQIDALQNELNALETGAAPRVGRPRGRPPGKRGPGRPPGSGRRKIKMTPERLASLARAREARWGKNKPSSNATPAANGRRKGKRKMSAAGRAAISAAAKKRWAKAKAQGKKTL